MTEKKGTRKPTVAFTNHQVAVNNIECKLAFAITLLKMCATSERGTYDELRRLIPKSVRAFNLWDGATIPSGLNLPGGDFKRNASETLAGAVSLQKRVVQFIDAARALKMQASPAPSQLESVAELKRRLKFSEVLRGIAETETIKYLRLARKLEEELANLRNSEATNAREMLLVIDKRNEEVAALRKQLNAVEAPVGKVTSLRASRNASQN